MHLSVWRAAIAACCLFCVARSALSQSEPLPLKMSDAVARALQHHPALRGFAFEMRVQDAHAAAATLRPLPQLEAVLEDAAGTGSRSGYRAAQTTLSLSQVIELGAKRAGRIGVIEAGRSELRTEHAADQLDVVAEVARRFIAVLDGQLRLDIAREGLAIAEKTQGLVERRMKAAQAPPAESSRAGVQVWEARLLLEEADHELEIARRVLAAAMGEKEVRFGLAAGDLLQFPALAPFAELSARIDAVPEIVRFADVQRLRTAELRLAEMRRRPDIKATLGIRRFEQEDELALVAGISVPLFTGRVAAPQIDAARASSQRVDSERATALLRIQAELFSQYTQLEHARGLASILRAELIPRLQTALEQTAYAYQRGRYSYLEWTVAQRDLLDARRRLVQAATDFHVIRIEIERLTGESLEATGVMP